ncbi:triple gene block protein 1 [Cassava virus X]|uniref:Triple gene block protein 1 n=1 Tax=Cassava virus X TaxID=1977392 RepID=A0A1W5VPH6_9VIRU|nr:triple gene block protein 1 [Cassava virus X]ARG47537.1 triple gene block protein 1 [Cassava virus X]
MCSHGLMDAILRELKQSGFVQIRNHLQNPLVVHAVAGAGKTTLLNKLAACSDLIIHSAAYPSGNSLSGNSVQIHNPSVTPDILDEYLLVPDYKASKLLIADPLQYSAKPPLAHFIKATTHRFGQSTCALLRSLLKIEVDSDRPDTVVISRFFEGEPEGAIIAFGEEAYHLISAHQLKPFRPCEVYGLSFPVVTVAFEQEVDKYPPHLVYLALSRHTEKLIILSDALASSS